MKNPFLFIFSTFFLINTPINSMTKNPLNNEINAKLKQNNEQTKIDFKFDQKPANMNTYEWACLIIGMLVKEKKEIVLKAIGANESQLNEYSKEIEKIDKDKWANANKELEIPLPKKIKNHVLKTITNNNVGQIFYKKEQPGNKRLIIIRKKNQDNQENKDIMDFDIRFLVMPKEINNLICSTDGYSVFISLPTYYKENKYGTWLNKSSLESQLGHELAHIILKHCTQRFCLRKLFEKLNKTKKIEERDFNSALKDWWKYAEAQADIHGLFGNIQWAKEQLACHSIKSKEGIKDPNHLPLQISKNYFEQIFNNMKKDNKLVI